MASLKTPCRTSYRSSIETIALNCLVFEEIAFLVRNFCEIRKDERTDPCQGHSRSLKMALFEFLFVCHCNYGHILYRFGAKARYGRKLHSCNEILMGTYTRYI